MPPERGEKVVDKSQLVASVQDVGEEILVHADVHVLVDGDPTLEDLPFEEEGG